jgi:hypothetical protein
MSWGKHWEDQLGDACVKSVRKSTPSVVDRRNTDPWQCESLATPFPRNADTACKRPHDIVEKILHQMLHNCGRTRFAQTLARNPRIGIRNKTEKK